MWRNQLYLVSIVCSITLAAACGSSPSETDQSGVFVGTVGEVFTNRTPILLALVNVVEPANMGFHTIMVYVTEETQILVEDGDGSIRVGSVEDLTMGSLAKVRSTGVMWRSEPPQIKAVSIEVTEPESST